MRAIVIVFAALLAAGCTCSDGDKASARPRASAAADEARLDAALSGRIAGPPQGCVDRGALGGNESFGRGAILFGDRTADVVYVNRPPAGCPALGVGRALVVRGATTQLCRGDIVSVFDPVSGVEYGSCSLGSFTPYRRVR